METYEGSCHCGAVTFRIKTDLDYSVRCDCSICRRHGAIMVRSDEKDLEILTGREHLTDYRFNTGVAIHQFCGTCGIYTFHKMRKLPDKYGVNAGCLAGVDLSALKPIFIEGSKSPAVAQRDQEAGPRGRAPGDGVGRPSPDPLPRAGEGFKGITPRPPRRSRGPTAGERGG